MKAWYIFPAILLLIGLTGVYFTIRSFKKGESIRLKKLLTVGMLIFLGGGVFLQKFEIVDIPQLRQLLIAFDGEEQNKEIEKREKQQQETKAKLDNVVKKAQESVKKIKKTK